MTVGDRKRVINFQIKEELIELSPSLVDHFTFSNIEMSEMRRERDEKRLEVTDAQCHV